MPKRRGRDEGSVTRRVIKHKDGTQAVKWRARVFLNGRRLSHDADIKDEANRWARKQLSDADQGLLPANGGKVMLGEFLETWLKTIEPTVKPKTNETYRDRDFAKVANPTDGGKASGRAEVEGYRIPIY